MSPSGWREWAGLAMAGLLWALGGLLLAVMLVLAAGAFINAGREAL